MSRSAPVPEPAAADVLVTPRLFENLLASERHIIALATTNSPLAFTQFRQIAKRSGQSIYQWLPEFGIVSIRDESVSVPSTQRMGDALRHIQRSLHFGIYVFVDALQYLQPVHNMLLRGIAEQSGTSPRKLIFLGQAYQPPEELFSAVEFVRCNDASRLDLKLRDGRWVRG